MYSIICGVASGLSLIIVCLDVPTADRARLTSSLHVCVGCEATPHEDPITGMEQGIQTVFLKEGMELGPCSLIAVSGKCTYMEDIHSNWGCFPTENCRFQGDYVMREDGSIGVFRDDRVPYCHWSMQEDPTLSGTGLTAGTPKWIAACDDGITWANVQFFAGAGGDCQQGSLCAEIQFGGKCSSCE